MSQKLAISLSTFLVALAVMVSPTAGLASDSAAETEAKGFSAGEMIMHHISDAHDWHILDWHGHPVSIPLPIIICDSEKGVSVFSSSRFEHGTASYNGYALDHGKIIGVDESGVKNEEATAAIIDISITKNVASLFISIGILLWLFLAIAKAYTRTKEEAPRGLQSLIEPVILFVRDDIAREAIGKKKHEKFVPYLLTIFFFIWLNNIMGLVPFFPGGANLTGNIVVPLVLAFITFIITSFNGNKHYWRHIFAMPGVPKGVLILLTPIEFLGMFIKPFVLMVRLFANITAGHIVLLVFFSLIFIASGSGTPDVSTTGGILAAIPSVAFTIFISVLELLVGFLQAFVFTFLSAIYFGMAVAEGDH